MEQRPRARGSVQLAYFAACAVSFEAGGQRVEGGFQSRHACYERRQGSFGNPGLDELRAWIVQHRPGSTIAVHYDPAWPPTVELHDPPEIFDEYSPRLFLTVAGVAGLGGLVLIAVNTAAWRPRAGR